MPAIFYVVFAGFIYAAGQITADKPEVILVKDGIVSEVAQAASPITVIVEGDNVEVRGARGGRLFVSAPMIAPKDTAPFRMNQFGQWTTDCHFDCHEDEKPWLK